VTRFLLALAARLDENCCSEIYCTLPMNPRPNRLREVVVSTNIEEIHSSSSRTSVSPQDLENLFDEQLIELLKVEESKSALAVLFARYRHLVFSISVKILRDRSEAEDVVQDIFLEICGKAQLFDSNRGSVKTWILQHAYSRSLNRLRYLSLRCVVGNNNNGNGHRKGTEASYSHDGLERLAFEWRPDKINRAFEALTDRQREVLRLIYFEGFLIKEVAEEMNETVVNIRNYYYRGLKRLREMLIDISAQSGLK
jgi:RNA polymerase sigma-70 factor, ECF subfamily